MKLMEQDFSFGENYGWEIDPLSYPGHHFSLSSVGCGFDYTLALLTNQIDHTGLEVIRIFKADPLEVERFELMVRWPLPSVSPFESDCLCFRVSE